MVFSCWIVIILSHSKQNGARLWPSNHEVAGLIQWLGCSPVPITKQQQQQLINYYTFFIVFTFVVDVVPSGEAHCVNPGGEESG